MEDTTISAEGSKSPITLGGRSFRVVVFEQRTVLQDHYLQRKIRESGVDKVMPMDGESNAVYLVRLQTALTDSGMAHELIAGYLIPEGKTEADWSQGMVKDIAKHIATCNTQADRDRVQGLCMEVVFGFFKLGLESLFRSLASSEKLASAQSEPEQNNLRH
jgi:hypothetical protein